MVFMKGVQLRKIFALCAVSVLGNAALCLVVTKFARLPLYMDTVFTVAACFSAGLAAGILTGVLSNICISLVFMYVLGLSFSMVKAGYVFTVCIIVEVLLVCFFHKKMMRREKAFIQQRPQKSFIDAAPWLFALVALDCVAMSVTGGIIDFIITSLSMPRYSFPEDTFKLGLLRNNVPLLVTAVLSRIPINIVDRFIAIFGGYGISLLFKKWPGKVSS